VNYALDAHEPGGVEQYRGIFHSARLSVCAAVESDPISVDKDLNAPKRSVERGPIRKIQGECGHAAAKGIWPMSMARQRPNVISASEQALRDVLAGVRECSRNRNVHKRGGPGPPVRARGRSAPSLHRLQRVEELGPMQSGSIAGVPRDIHVESERV
jgi:hypothetical protein